MSNEIHNVELMGGPIVMYIRPPKGSEAKITIEYDKVIDRWRLICDDLVINEWVEFHPYLSHALLRVGALARCAETDWEAFFTESTVFDEVAPSKFTDSAEEFLNTQTSCGVETQTYRAHQWTRK